MAGPDDFGGGGIAGSVGGAIANKVVGGLIGHLTERTPKIGDARRQIIREIPGVRVVRGTYYLPAIPGTAYTAPMFTNVNKKVLKWYRTYVSQLPDPTEGPPDNPYSYPPPAPGASTPPFLPSIDLPRIPPSITLPGFGSIFARAGGLLGAVGLFWPTAAGEGSDLRDYYAKNAPKPAGRPGARGRRRPGRQATRPRRRPRAIGYPGRGGSVTIGKPNVRAVPPPAVLAGSQYPIPRPPPGAWERDTAGEPFTTPGSYGVPATSSRTSSRTSSSTSTSSSALPKVATPPIAGTGTAAPATTSTLSKALGYLTTVAPFALPFLFPAQSPSASPRPALALAPAPAPLTWPSTAAVPYAATDARECSCAKTKKRRKNTCRNPVTKRKRETRGGHKFVTITKRLDCERGKSA